MRPTFWRRSYTAKLQESLEVETLRPLPKKREDAPGGPGGLPRGAYRKPYPRCLCGLGSTHGPHRKRLRTTNGLERLNQEIKMELLDVTGEAQETRESTKEVTPLHATVR